MNDEAGVRSACAGLTARLGQDMTGILVQQMISGGVEMLVGATVDPLFGSLVVCSTGGILVDILDDSAIRLTPVTQLDAQAMVDELRGVKLLRGYRNAPRADQGALSDAIERVSALVESSPEIVELDVNPLKVLPSGVCAVDVRIRVQRLHTEPPSRRVQY